MAVRLASDTIRTLYALQCITKDIKHRSQSPVYKSNPQEMCKIEVVRQMSSKSSSDSVQYDLAPSETLKRNQKQRNGASCENALVHKVHPTDRSSRNIVKERAKSEELDDILAKWNVYKPKK